MKILCFSMWRGRGRNLGLARLLILLLAFGAGGDVSAWAKVLGPAAENEPIHLQADELIHDDARQLVVASGHVEFTQGGRIVKADRVSYALRSEVVTAEGNVVLLDQNGDVHFAKRVELTRDLRDGYIRALRSTLADGSRFTAQEGQRIGGRYIEMHEATYTPCEPCKLNPDKPPTWQLRAAEVTHDTTDKSIAYHDAQLEMWGVPVLYTPYFSHPDGTEKQKSGFLAPTAKLDSQNGTSVGTRYYWALDPSRDATFGLEAYTKQAPRVLGEYRQRFDNARIELDASATYSERRVRENDETVTRDAEGRGHIAGKGLWEINDQWRSGMDLNLASDDQYFRQYDVTAEDVLENQLYVERFDGRDYAVARALAFQDLRTSDRAADQPNILPEIEADFWGDPGTALGGRWMVGASALGLQRSGSGADMNRGSLELGWQRRDIMGPGIVTTLDASVRGDAYYIMDRGDSLIGGEKPDRTLFRGVPVAQATASLPMVKPMRSVDLLFEPVAAVTLVTNVDQGDIPNEDSQDVQLDISNLFEKNRFNGYDRVEDLSRITYGSRFGVSGHDGSGTELFLGQSHRFNNADNPFPQNSGLDRQESDVVGRLKLNYRDVTRLDYGFQLNGDSLGSVRQEVDHMLNLNPVTLNTRYLYAKSIEGEANREQIQSIGSYALTDEWRALLGANYDFGEDSGLRRSLFGFDYTGQCVNFSAIAQRHLTQDSSGESGTELMLRLGFKNLGTFQTSGISLNNSRRETLDSSDIVGQDNQ